MMRLTTGCFKDNQLQRLLREGDIWGLGILFVWFVVLKWILREATVNVLSSICWAVLLSALSLSLPVIHLSIFKWGERLCQAALQGRKHPIQSQQSVSFIINYTDCYGACLCHQRSPVWHLFILPFQQKATETLGLFIDTRDLMRWQCKQRSLSAWTGEEINLIFFYWKDLKLLLWLGEKSMDNSHFSSVFLPLLTLA